MHIYILFILTILLSDTLSAIGMPFLVEKTTFSHGQEETMAYDALKWNEEDLLQHMQILTKTELHLHLGGAWPLEYLRDISPPDDFQELVQRLDQIAKGEDYHQIFSVFTLINRIVRTEQQVEQGVVALCENLYRDGIVYAELRTGLKDLGSGLEGYLNAVLKGIKRGVKGKPLKIGLILSLRRDMDPFIANQTIDLALKYRDRGVVGMDLSGNSTKGNSMGLLAALTKSRENGLPLTLHIGESKDEAPEQQIGELLAFLPRRIGHGVHLSPQAIQWILDHRIPVELCLTSALITGMITKSEDHPALQLLREGHPVAICTDDPLLFDTTLSKECAKIAYLLGIYPKEMQAFQNLTRSYAFDFGSN